ncbi:DUF58 domain-containing protein [Sanguibacter sp. Leaf3]|uniref:DUF58 domain-containing protein n=1 Tax=Sanguibacter sp. Leaf3 TaxID=1736209 RepID=UPI0009E85A54|nr:DUF58 domain-containing protein [Sanguibacter sp. Leaf3]
MTSGGVMTRGGAEQAAAARSSAPARWERDAVVVVSALTGLVLVCVGLVFGRPQVVALAVPLVLSAVWAAANRPTGPVRVTTVAGGTAVRDRELVVALTLEVPDGASVVRVQASSPGNEPLDALVAVPGGARTVDLTTPSVRTGPRELFSIDAVPLADEGGWFLDASHVAPDHVLVLPRVRRLDVVPVRSQLRGLTGPHSSRRPGDGSQLRDIALFRPGDSVRRVDWRTTARRSPEVSELYVRRTFAASEASVVIVVDSRDDVGPEVATWGGYRETAPDVQTSLDIAREAAATIATVVVDGGDRLGFEDLGRLHTPVPMSGGKRHLQRVVHALALARPAGAPRHRERPPQIPTGSMVYLFSTFLDDSASQIALRWSAQGHEVVAVDTLPEEILRGLDRREVHAWRLTDIARRDRLFELSRSGVTVLRWASGDPSIALRARARAVRGHS